MKSIAVALADASATRALGAVLATACRLPSVVYLHGELGAGKTTLVQGSLAALGYPGRVRSPTYTLVESYRLPSLIAYHFDLYRLADPEELEYIGLRDYQHDACLWLVEWPQRGTGVLPPADVSVTLEYAAEGRLATLQGVVLPDRQALSAVGLSPR